MQISARINLDSLEVEKDEMKERADKLAEGVWNETRYRYMYAYEFLIFINIQL